MDNLDAALDGFNEFVAREQEREQRRVALALAETCGVSFAEARAALAACQWSVARARKRLLEMP